MLSYSCVTISVSIHAPTRGATCVSLLPYPQYTSFNPRPHAGGDTSRCSTYSSTACFNPRPHAGGDITCYNIVGDYWVSIHAPTRGATCCLQGFLSAVGFNPRPHAGGDTMAATEYDLLQVSIHAPTRGATSLRSHGTTRRSFQSTPPRGGRQQMNSRKFVPAGFNPRPHAGGDQRSSLGLFHRTVSIHAPTRGATKADEQHLRIRRFQSTPPRGGRPDRRHAAEFTEDVSIHAPTRGAT